MRLRGTVPWRQGHDVERLELYDGLLVFVDSADYEELLRRCFSVMSLVDPDHEKHDRISAPVGSSVALFAWRGYLEMRPVFASLRVNG